MSHLLNAAAEWDGLATAEIKGAKIAARHGDTTSFEVRARIARRAAEALRIQHKTGQAVCTCCHRPLSNDACDNH